MLHNCIGVTTPKFEGGVGQVYKPEDEHEVDVRRDIRRKEFVIEHTTGDAEHGTTDNAKDRRSLDLLSKARRPGDHILPSLILSNHPTEPLRENEIPASRYSIETMGTRRSLSSARLFRDPRAAPIPICRSTPHSIQSAIVVDPEEVTQLVKQLAGTFPKTTGTDHVDDAEPRRCMSSGCLHLNLFAKAKDSFEDAMSAFKPKAKERPRGYEPIGEKLELTRIEPKSPLTPTIS
jgi:hypothetical protein